LLKIIVDLYLSVFLQNKSKQNNSFKNVKFNSMQINKLFRTFILLTSILIVSSCAIHPLQFGKVENAKVSKNGKSTLRAEIMLPIENTNFFKIKVQDVILHISLNNIELGKLKLDNNLVLPAHSKDIYTFPFELDFGDKITGILSLTSLLAEGHAKFTIEGSLKGGICFFSKTFTIKDENTIKLQR